MELPDDIVRRLALEELTEVFAGLHPAHQREYLQWVDEAKQPEDRQKRIIAMCVLIADKSED